MLIDTRPRHTKGVRGTRRGGGSVEGRPKDRAAGGAGYTVRYNEIDAALIGSVCFAISADTTKAVKSNELTSISRYTFADRFIVKVYARTSANRKTNVTRNLSL